MADDEKISIAVQGCGMTANVLVIFEAAILCSVLSTGNISLQHIMFSPYYFCLKDYQGYYPHEQDRAVQHDTQPPRRDRPHCGPDGLIGAAA